MKITSNDCKRELDDQLPDSYGQSARGWKRVSRTGSVQTEIVRVFHHRELPVTGTVVERDGAIVSVEFAPLDDTESSAGTNAESTPVEPVSNGTNSADEFLFALCKRHDGYRHIAICEVDFWNRHRHLSDSVNKRTMQGLLPDGVEEEAESFFCTSMKAAALKTELRRRGFKEDPAFTRFVADIF